jgi:hypothetical protein
MGTALCVIGKVSFSGVYKKRFDATKSPEERNGRPAASGGAQSPLKTVLGQQQGGNENHA